MTHVKINGYYIYTCKCGGKKSHLIKRHRSVICIGNNFVNFYINVLYIVVFKLFSPFQTINLELSWEER